MVDSPDAGPTTTIWQNALADPVHGQKIMEQTFRSHPLLKYIWKKEIAAKKGFQSDTGKYATVKNGYDPVHIKYQALSYIAREIVVAAMATTGAINVEDAITTDVDLALPTNPLRVLSGDYGCIYGAVTWGLEERVVRGGSGPKNINKWMPRVRNDIAQQLSAALSTGLYSDGTSDKIDGLAYWRATTGTKWNSQNIANTDTFLQGQAASISEAQFTYAKWIELLDIARLGAISGTNSDGHKPNVCVMTTALFRKLKVWLYDKKSIHVPQAGDDFVTLGTPQDYMMVDGVCCFADDHLDDLKSTNFGLMYFLHSDDIEVIFHSDYGFVGVDAYKMGGETPEQFTEYEIPSKLFKQGLKKIILVNFFYKRPRNLLYVTVT